MAPVNDDDKAQMVEEMTSVNDSDIYQWHSTNDE